MLFPVNKGFGKCRHLLSQSFDRVHGSLSRFSVTVWLLEVMDFRGINADRPNPFPVGEKRGVAVDHALNSIEFILGM